MSVSARRSLALAALVLASGGLLSACTFSVGGGVVAALVAALLGGGLLLSAASQTGCSGVGPCLSTVPDPNTRRAPDAGGDQKSKPGPCLTMRPCLSVHIPKRDTGPASQPQKEPDAALKPCLSMHAPGGASGSISRPTEADEGPRTSHAEAVARVQSRLPDDLAHRLGK